MFSKVFLSALAALLVAQTMADRTLCPEPEDANLLIYKQNVREAAPEFGRVEKTYFIPPIDKTITCITFTGTQTGSVTSLGFTDKGINVRLVSDIQHGFDAVLDVYSKE